MCLFLMYMYYATSVNNNCLKVKSEEGMAVLKSKRTRVVGIISTYSTGTYSVIVFTLFLQCISCMSSQSLSADVHVQSLLGC